MKFEVIGQLARFGIGQKLVLDKDQIAARSHKLDVGKKGNVFVLDSIEFKRGEVIGIAGSYDKLPSSLKAVLAPAGKAKPKEDAPDLEALELAATSARQALADFDESIPEDATLTADQVTQHKVLSVAVEAAESALNEAKAD